MSVPIDCEHCGHHFEADSRFAGGFTNCTDCGKATPVAGLRDPLWRMLQLGAVLAAIGVGFLFYATGSPSLGIAVGVAIAAGLWVLSRAF